MAIKESPDTRWPGTVLLAEYMNFKDLLKWETAMNEAKKVTVAQKDAENITTADFYLKLLPTATSLVTEWHISGLPDKVDENNFPASTKLMSWLIECVSDLYTCTNSIDSKP
jgi:hypothetical protein